MVNKPQKSYCYLYIVILFYYKNGQSRGYGGCRLALVPHRNLVELGGFSENEEVGYRKLGRTLITILNLERGEEKWEGPTMVQLLCWPYIPSYSSSFGAVDSSASHVCIRHKYKWCVSVKTLQWSFSIHFNLIELFWVALPFSCVFTVCGEQEVM